MLTEEMKTAIADMVKSAVAEVVTEEKSVTPETQENVIKSIEDVKSAGIINDEELGLLQAWRSGEIEIEKEEEVKKSQTATPSTDDLNKAIASAVVSQIEPLKKSLDEKDQLIKSLQADLEKVKETPAYDKKAVDNLDVIEKGDATEKEEKKEVKKSFNKEEIMNALFELQKANVASSKDICEYDATGELSNKAVKTALYQELTK